MNAWAGRNGDTIVETCRDEGDSGITHAQEAALTLLWKEGASVRTVDGRAVRSDHPDDRTYLNEVVHCEHG